jgi:hypothetical protein
MDIYVEVAIFRFVEVSRYKLAMYDTKCFEAMIDRETIIEKLGSFWFEFLATGKKPLLPTFII